MNKLRIVFITTGTVLIFSALFLCLYNMNENKRASEEAASTLSELIAAIPEPTVPEETTLPVTTAEPDLFAPYETTVTTAPPLPTIELDGQYYCGYLTIPALGVELPVVNELTYPALRYAPCRYSGTVSGGDLVIAAHNYSSHFGRIKELAEGDEICFTDCEGNQHCYTVISTDSVDGTDIGSMLGGSSEEWQLTLFTCDLSGRSRIAIRTAEKE
ncbi:MAG: sortase [Ruminococcus sp.]|nr:sortase [Ruminococcus sp.]